jgi:hypothetical protein
MAITSWQYEDAPSQLSSMLGLDATKVKTKIQSDVGGGLGKLNCTLIHTETDFNRTLGNTPPKHIDLAARRIAEGTSKVCVIGGGESWYSLNAWANQNKSLPLDWTPPPKSKKVAATSREREFKMASDYCERHGITK